MSTSAQNTKPSEKFCSMSIKLYHLDTQGDSLFMKDKHGKEKRVRRFYIVLQDLCIYSEI